MRVYLDFQIWDYINKNEYIREFFKKQKEWDYLISVAHLEELYKAQLGEHGNKIGLTNELKNTIKEIALDGVIKPTKKGVKYIPKCFEKTYTDIVKYDTQNPILEKSLIRRDIDKEAYNPTDLFKGIKHNKNDEYKLVWETIRVRNEIAKLKNNYDQLIIELRDPNNSHRKTMEDLYGKDTADYMMNQLLISSNIDIKPAIYSEIRDDYSTLEYVIEQLYLLLTKCGFKRDTSDKHANSGTYDIQHSICATLCDIFITNDDKFADKFKAIAYYLGIPIEIKTWNEDILPQINLDKNNI